ncbi:MAG: tetratricopeptide repeat protein [Opitutaceae bacterium]|nr:tetratricopeptide repeat protein [Opitutaceae bacterium]
MRIVEILIWFMGLIWAVAQGLNIRQKAKREQATEHTFELHALLLAVSVIIVPILSLSPLHLLWMIPASFVLGLASVIPPLNLLWFPASLYGHLWYVGTRNRARALYLAGDYAKAIEAYEETIRLKPQSAEAHFNLGVAYGKVGDKEKAIESFKNTIRLSPDSAEAYCNLGFNYKDLGSLSDAVDSFREAIRIRPGYARAIWNLGMVHVEMGDLDNALKQYDALLAIDRKHADELHAAITAARKSV